MSEATAAPTRPVLHLTAPAGWINDPLGLTYRNGQYHLFFQHVPGRTSWAPTCHWGHATSPDLFSWTQRPIALAPDESDGGCWSGSIVVEPDGTASLFYTSVALDDLDIGTVRVAHPVDDSWDRWQKGEVVAQLPPGTDAGFYRDPYVYWADGTWQMLIGSGRADGTAIALVHRSPDLVRWHFDGELAARGTDERDPVWTGRVWECPQLFRLGDRWVLTVSVWEPWIPHYEAYAIGDLVGGRFVPTTWGRLTYGPCYYAGSAFVDADGERGLIYWLREIVDPDGQWAGANSVPHRLRLDGDRLTAEPHPGLDRLRQPVEPESLPSVADLEWRVPAVSGRLVLTSADGGALVSLVAAPGELEITIGDQSWTLPPSPQLRLVLDGPILEVFGEFGTFAAPVPVAAPLSAAATPGTELTTYALVRPRDGVGSRVSGPRG